MKYIKRIFEAKTINMTDEFQSCIDMIVSNKSIKMNIGPDWIEFTYKGYTDQPISLEEFTKEYNKMKIINELHDDIIHVCNRLKDDGYDMDIVLGENSIRVSVDIESDENFVKLDDNNGISIDRSKLNRFFKKIGIKVRQIQLDEIKKDKYSWSIYDLNISVMQEPTDYQYEQIENKIAEANKDGKLYDGFYYEEEDMEISIQFKSEYYVYFST